MSQLQPTLISSHLGESSEEIFPKRQLEGMRLRASRPSWRFCFVSKIT